MDKLVSVILPVYGVEAYLAECVDSLLRQTYERLEIILVDDESPDRCGRICDDYAAKDSRVLVIHKKNGGAASARNAGLEAATGELICFVDSDDTVEPDYVQVLLETLGDADMAMCGFYLRNCTESRKVAIQAGDYNRERIMRRFLKDWSCSLLWNKMIRRSAIGDIRMEEGHRVDDEFFTYQVALNCRCVAVSDRCLYHYRLRSSSVMQDDSAVKERMMLDRISYVTTRYERVSAAVPAVEKAYFTDAADTLSRYWIHSLNMPQAQYEIRQWVRRHSFRMLTMGKGGLILLRCFWLTKPHICGEPNPLGLPEEELFA